MTWNALRLCLIICMFMALAAFPLFAVDQQCVDECADDMNTCVDTYVLECVQATCNLQLIYCLQDAQQQYGTCVAECVVQMGEGGRAYCENMCYAQTYANCYYLYNQCYAGCYETGVNGCMPAYLSCIIPCQD